MASLSRFGNALGFHLTNFGLAGLAELPFEEPFPPPPDITLAVAKPTMKNPKYISAAGSEIGLGSTGSRLKVTEPLFFMPIRINNPMTASTKTVLKNSFIFKKRLTIGLVLRPVNQTKITGLAAVCKLSAKNWHGDTSASACGLVQSNRLSKLFA